jgi:hypothetical protein
MINPSQRRNATNSSICKIRKDRVKTEMVVVLAIATIVPRYASNLSLAEWGNFAGGAWANFDAEGANFS